MFENLKGVLGDVYHDDITAEEVNNFFSGKKFTDLSTGQYVDKNKYDRDILELNNKISEKQNALNSKMTDDEKRAADFKSKDAEIERLQTLLRENTLVTNKGIAENATSSVKALLGLKDDDDDFNSFISNITTEDNAKTSSISKYVTKLINDAYEKGKKDSTREAMGNFGKSQGEGNHGAKKDDEDNLGKRLAQHALPKREQVDYFKRNN